MNERKPSNGLNSALKSISGESRWCVWKYAENPDNPRKPKKEPINPRTGGGAMSNQPSTWADFDTAYTAREKFGAKGVGFFMGGGYAGIDIDDCIDDSGKLSDMAAKIIEKMNSYTETSPRGHGIHILCRVSEGFTLDGKQGVKKKGLELYCGGRYLTVTGHVLGAEKPIELRENELLEVYREYFVIPRENEAKKQAVNVSQGRNNLRVAGDESDNELWTRIFDSQNGAKIRALYNGDISAYDNDESRADLALCCYLAYWTGHDAVRIDRMFRQSGLMREKWNRTDYRENTIAKAMNDTLRYSPSVMAASTPKKTGGIDWKYNPANYSPDDNDSGHDEESAQDIKPITPPENRVQNESPAQSENDSAHGTEAAPKNEAKSTVYYNAFEYLETSFTSDLERIKLFSERKTGYINIDRYNSLFPALYIVGSVSGNGKTTFCGQMADYLAGTGEHVLYFTLEQTQLELISKGLARLTAQEVIKTKTLGADALTKYTHTDAMTAIDIRKGGITDAVKRAIKKYKTFAKNLWIIECGFDWNVEKIINFVKMYMDKFGVKPVVFVDYLQITKPAKEAAKMPKRDAIDDTVQRFKKLSAENDLAVILISSLNRQNYLSVVDFESFKESGGIEYTADVVWGLQLLGMNAGVFDKEAKLQTKRKFVRECMNASPRWMEILGLKNRYGRSKTRYFFDYYAAYDLFIPYEAKEPEKTNPEDFAEMLDGLMEQKFKEFEEKQTFDSENSKKPKKSK